MSATTLGLWLVAGALWVYALFPLIRLKRHLNAERQGGKVPAGVSDSARIRAILGNRAHPLHRDARRMMAAYGGFLFCWIVGYGLTFAVSH